MESSIWTTETIGRGTNASKSCSPNDEVRNARARDARDSRLSWLPAARRPRGGAPAPPGGRPRRPHQRPPETGARAGRRDHPPLRLAPRHARLGLLRGRAHGRDAAQRQSARHAPPERVSRRREALPAGGDGGGLVGLGGGIHAATGDSAWGNHTVKVLPAPGALSTVMWPPCSSAKSRAMARPSPVPPRSRLRD